MAYGLDVARSGSVASIHADLDGCLGRLAELPGVALAALIDREGFVLASAGEWAPDPEGPAAVASWLVEALDGAGELLGQGTLESVLLQHVEGAMLVTPAGPGAILAIVAHDPAALGDARHDVSKTLLTLRALL